MSYDPEDDDADGYYSDENPRPPVDLDDPDPYEPGEKLVEDAIARMSASIPAAWGDARVSIEYALRRLSYGDERDQLAVIAAAGAIAQLVRGLRTAEIEDLTRRLRDAGGES
jgi:hypothetical protein